jgi:Aspartyl protease
LRTHFICIALVAVVIFYPSSSGAQSVALLAGHSPYIPFHLASGYLIVAEGTIGNSEHLKFVIDTGTVRTCIDRRLARQLGLSLEPHAVLRFDRMVRMNSTHLPSLTLGPLRAENFAVNVADLSHVGRSATQVSGIVGLDLLEPFPFQIDYEQMQIAFGPLPSLAESAAMDSVPWLPVVSLSFNRSNSRLLIDTGAHDIVLYYENLRGPTYNWKLLGTETWGDSIGGLVQARKAVFQGAAFGSDRGYDEVYLIHAPLNHPLPTVDGVLSPLAFGIRQIGFDFDRHIVTWTRRQAGTR